jgi:hypothetical protein
VRLISSALTRGDADISEYVSIDGKQRTGTLYESDEFSHKLSKLKEDIQAVLQD